jgi:hypothetical protein
MGNDAQTHRRSRTPTRSTHRPLHTVLHHRQPRKRTVDGIASVVAVVESETAPAAAAGDAQPPDIVLWLFLVEEDGQWKLRNLAPMPS